ncbi:cyclopropane-fatty-acyl-phospholipid synthase family protein [Viridibacterium curvum]|uniref:Class I SAM-dependent methyltransferase n=1 Tax=Viridibacterium curvum TaxID=1101404 RepID=A0ABP9QNY1_9RHOO
MNDPRRCVALAEAKRSDPVVQLLLRLFRGFHGRLGLRLWNDETLTLGAQHADEPAPPFTLVLRNPAVVRTMLLGRNPLRLAEAHFRGDIDIEGGFFAALDLKNHLHAIRLSLRDRLHTALTAFRLRATRHDPVVAAATRAQPPAKSSLHGRIVKAHSRPENRAAIQFHYDVSNDFYALWLDKAMVYSCAYFESESTSLEQAQQAKLDYICRKLQLQPGDRLLDIGCGWGALILHAARHYGVNAYGITLSRPQLAVVQERIAEAGLTNRVKVELRDYRDLEGINAYEKIASVGMFEHVGLKNLPVYFATAHRLLVPGGLFLNHGITHDVEGWEKTLYTEFINRYVFPDGQLDTMSNIQRGMERVGFEIADVEGLRAHYALTLRHWVARLEQHHDAALRHVSEATWRVWRLYMAACALDFESGETGVYQILASKRTAGPIQLPLTRRHLYPTSADTI